MGNRVIPFGYKVDRGKVVANLPEADVVQEIFRRYLLGESLNKISEWLTEGTVPYGEGRLWNKHIVGRLLKEERYTGAKDYPQLVDQALFTSVTKMRALKSIQEPRNEVAIVLRKLCGGAVTSKVEDEVLQIINMLICQPELVQMSSRKQKADAEAMALEDELDKVLDQRPVDEEKAAALVMKLSSAKYAKIGAEEYETTRIRLKLRGHTKMEKLDEQLVKEIVSAITVEGDTAVIILKNSQVIGREESL